jgi:integrase
MRKRFQNGRVVKSTDGRYWIGKWLENGRDRSKILGKTSKMTKTKAREEMAKIVKPINERAAEFVSPNITIKDFVQTVYLPFYRRKWKRSTAMTNEDRVNHHIVTAFGNRELRAVTRDDLQRFLEAKASLSFSTTDHLRWDLKQLFELGQADGVVVKNPAIVLFTPRECKRPDRQSMSMKEVQNVLSLLDLRERLIVKLAILAGMRPGEIFGLRRGMIGDCVATIQERVYRGDIDTPKTVKSVRLAALSAGVRQDLDEWMSRLPEAAPSDWLFPSEKTTKPISRDNAMRRYIRPRLEKAGYGWIDFHVMRRTHSSLMRGLGVDPKIVADQQGHTLDVNLNVYTETSVESRIEAVEALGSALVN